MIRALKNEEADIIMNIWLKSTIRAHRFIEQKYWEDNYSVVKNQYIPIAKTYVYEDEKYIKGFISIIDNEFIGALFVDVDSQGKRIGTQLLDYAQNKYKNLKLAVYKDNKESVRFYKSRGFEIIAEQKNEDSGFDEYVMKK